MTSRANELRDAPLMSSNMPPAVPPVPQIEPVPNNRKISRKRTKTGCLTCRKRRIKCGEERPICNNCIKSKRHCEGYNQRVIFKPPAVDWRSTQQGPASTLQYHSGLIPGRSDYELTQQTSDALANAPLTPLRPRPSLEFPAANVQSITTGPSSAGLEQTSLPFKDPYMPRTTMPVPSSYSQDVPQAHADSLPSLPSLPPQYYNRPVQASNPVATAAEQSIGFKVPVYTQEEVPVSLSPRGNTIYSEEQRTPSSGTTMSTFSPGLHSPSITHPPQMQYAPYRSFSTVDRRSPLALGTKSRIHYNARHHSLNHFDFNTSPWPSSATDASHFVSPTYSRLQERPIMHPEVDTTSAEYHMPTASDAPKEDSAFKSQTFYDIAPIDSPDRQHVSPTQLLHKAAVEFEDDDYYDVDSTDDLDVEKMSAMDVGSNRLSLMRSIHHAASSGINVRSYDTFLYEGFLDHYRPESVASPLKNPRTAGVFAHFIHATGPSLSIFERNPRSSPAIFAGGPVPASQQSLWTYTLPMLALRHQGLLHAMLALASLHIAKIKGGSATPSFKHYAFALKRIHHCVGHPQKRLLIATIAATLLLGFYEILTADHTKWSSHLLGAKQLFTEIDFASMAKEYTKVKAEEAAIDSAALARTTFLGNIGDGNKDFPRDSMKPVHSDADDRISIIDERIISTIIGQKVSYSDFGRVLGDTERKDSHHPSSKPFDVSRFEVLQDLFWWYCKQDAYHSILSGDPLLLDFREWSECPPRCALGRNEGTYGSSDHLTLLLGRIADFASRDRKRKIKAVQLNGGIWKPPGSTANTANAGTTPNFNVSASLSRNKLQSAGPTSAPFYGMAPAGRSRMPSSYGVDPTRSPSESPTREEFDIKSSTESAIQEWEQIRDALDVFSSNLGPSYQPLPAEYTTPFQTPFGEAIQYRSYDIGILWAIYHMTRLILIRSHPNMPPAATMAAGVGAHQTAWIANTIGRIAAGIVPTSLEEPISPVLGSALVDSTMPLFFAGVQLIDPAQRAWLVSRVRKIEERTSWASIGVIASGCETAWVKAAEAGRGPPYERVRDTKNVDERVSGITSEGGSTSLDDSADRRFVHVNSGTRAHFAIGIIGEEEDVRA